MNTNNNEKVSVVVARFEVASLTEGHKTMLDYVLSQGYGTNLLILGVSPLLTTKQNPLDFESRRLMVEQEYPGKFTILYIKDQPDDDVWSKNLDNLIKDVKGMRDIVMIGSRDSFFEHYTGEFKNTFQEYKQSVFISGTEQRASLARQLKSSKDWRAGVVYATQNRYPTAYATVDCAIFDDDNLDHIYLAKKNGEKKYLFVGGFVDPNDDSHEMSALREAMEETKLETSIISYIGSKRVDDWRYRNEADKILTSLFAMKKTFGRAEASDDISELHLKEFDKLTINDFEDVHKPLFIMVLNWRRKYRSQHNLTLKEDVLKMMD